MKFLFYYHRIPQTKRELNALGGSFGAHAQDLMRGLEAAGHICLDLAYDSTDAEKESFYKEHQPDRVVIIDSWLRCMDNLRHALSQGMHVIPFLVSDLHCSLLPPDVVTTLNTLPLILVPSEWVKSNFLRDGVEAKRVKVVKESVNTQLFAPASSVEAVTATRQKYHIANSDILIFTIAGEIEEKGGYDIIEAMKNIGDPHLKYVAKVWKKDEIVNEKVLANEAYIKQSGISDQIQLIEDVLTPREIIELYQACDIYAAPSKNEGFGRPHIEAQSCGKPVITINASAAGENVVHLQTGYLVKVGSITMTDSVPEAFIPDHQDLMSGLKLLSDPVKRHAMGKAARRNALDHFDTAIITQDFLKAIS